MPRNTQKDIRAEALRRERILMAGLRLFSQQSIEQVSMDMVAQAAGVGPTTLFKYYKSKERLVVAISAMAWTEEWHLALEHYGPEMQETMTAYELIQCYTDWIILVYRRNPALLRFSGDYKSYICRQNPPQEELQEHLEALQPSRPCFTGPTSGPRTMAASAWTCRRIPCIRPRPSICSALQSASPRALSGPAMGPKTIFGSWTLPRT